MSSPSSLSDDDDAERRNDGRGESDNGNVGGGSDHADNKRRRKSRQHKVGRKISVVISKIPRKPNNHKRIEAWKDKREDKREDRKDEKKEGRKEGRREGKRDDYRRDDRRDKRADERREEKRKKEPTERIENKIGAGSYGSVFEVDGHAIKKFDKSSYLIQEYIGYSITRHSSYIAKAKTMNFKRMELKMVLYTTSLSRWMNKNCYPSDGTEPRVTYDEKMRIFRGILLGLCEIHGRDLVHGDIKPGNILLDINSKTGKISVRIADLGFMSLTGYSKVDRTAPVYSDIDVVNTYQHDMFSLGIILFELFGNLLLNKQARTYSELASAIDENISDPDMKKLILSLTDETHDNRPTSMQILKEWFPDSVKKVNIREYKTYYTNSIDKNRANSLWKWMSCVAKDLKINRVKEGYDALITHLSCKEIGSEKYQLYAACMLMILSSIFSDVTILLESDVRVACRKKYSVIEVLKTITKLVIDNNVLSTIMKPSSPLKSDDDDSS